MKRKAKNDKFYISIQGWTKQIRGGEGRFGNFVEIKGKPVIIPGFTKFEFFLHRPLQEKNSRFWRISERESGVGLGVKELTQRAAIGATIRSLRHYAKTNKNFRIAIEKKIKLTGLSPAY